MDRLEFEVLSSDGETVYIVDFQKFGEKVAASCSCPAGQNLRPCKHRFEIINGEYGRIVSGNISDVEKVRAMVVGSELEAKMKLVEEAERAHERTKRELIAAKNAVAKAMQG